MGTKFTYTFNNYQYSLTISTNNFYPTWESMFIVYAGISDTSFIEQGWDPSPPGQSFKVSSFVRVR